jgi:hypothetical protein
VALRSPWAVVHWEWPVISMSRAMFVCGLQASLMAMLRRDNDNAWENFEQQLAAIFFPDESVFQSPVSPNLVSIR